mgnify:CR=1 FL=1
MKTKSIHLIWICHLLNFLDAVLTLHHLCLGASEANPIMDHFYSISPISFLLAKFILFVSSIEFLNFILENEKSRILIFTMILIIMMSVFAWHIWGLFLIP